MYRSRARGLAAAVLGVALLAACGSNGSNASSGSSQAASSDGSSGGSLVIGVAPAAAYVPIMYGVDNGYFSKEGLNASIQVAPGGAALVPAMQSGSVQIGGSNLLSVLQAQQKGLDMKCVSGAYRSNTSALIGSPKTGSDIKSGSDLEGKTVAVNALASATQLVVEKWVKDHGGDPSKVNFVAVGFSDQASALQSGQVDAALADEPFTTAMVNQGFPVIQKAPADTIKKNVTFGCWVGLGDWVSGHASQIKAFSAAVNKVNTFLLNNPNEFRKALVKYLHVSDADAQAVILPDVTTELSNADLEAWQKPAVSFGLLQGEVELKKVDGGFSDN